MNALRSKLFLLIAVWTVIAQSSGLTAEQIPVRHVEGVTLRIAGPAESNW